MTVNLLWDQTSNQSWLKTISEQLGALDTKAGTLSTTLTSINAQLTTMLGMLQIDGDVYSQIYNIRLNTQNSATTLVSILNEIEHHHAYLDPALLNKLQEILDAMPDSVGGESTLDYRVYIDEIEYLLRNLLECCRTQPPIIVQPQLSMSIFGEQKWNDPPSVRQLNPPATPTMCELNPYKIEDGVTGLYRRDGGLVSTSTEWKVNLIAAGYWGVVFHVNDIGSDVPDASGNITIMSLPPGRWYNNYTDVIGIGDDLIMGPEVSAGDVIQLVTTTFGMETKGYLINGTQNPNHSGWVCEFCPTNMPVSSQDTTTIQVQQQYDKNDYRCQKAHWFAMQLKDMADSMFDTVGAAPSAAFVVSGAAKLWVAIGMLDGPTPIMDLIGTVATVIWGLLSIDRIIFNKLWDWQLQRAIICSVYRANSPNEIIKKIRAATNIVLALYGGPLGITIAGQNAVRQWVRGLTDPVTVDGIYYGQGPLGEVAKEWDNLEAIDVSHYPRSCACGEVAIEVQTAIDNHNSYQDLSDQ